MKLRLLYLFAALFIATTPALADPVTLDLATIDTFEQLFSNPSATFDRIESTAFGTPFTRFVNTFEPVTGAGEAWIGLDGLSLDWSSFDSLQLWVRNDNESDWEFQLVVKDSANTEALSSLVVLSPGQSTVLSLNLDGGLNKSDINQVLIRLTGDLPRDG
ncbi:MAG TPA: hypothetical protein VKZ59_03325, partial [Acidobacteriota bacterium]|nr:hypothetical protein [Acidobacteriota bacterium]